MSRQIKNILIIEDEEDLVSLLADRLKREGYSVSSSSSQEDALIKLTNEKFHCLIIDILLKAGTGDRLIALIRNDPAGLNATTPILVISGHLHTDLVKKIAPTVKAILVKPFPMDKFVKKVRQLTD